MRSPTETNLPWPSSTDAHRIGTKPGGASEEVRLLHDAQELLL
eukprot:CAMPEP_0197875764 /NCGR_PEP_ID=MMETSP1439-20131203/4930_1 /TAXON_ID=66791 /ORGANISM="Gonyaulax spinifera, Strain CCMP409" /LENGTH=42 /DNA_ID= /DNA_START= /DNA_END= /DNA_ORIENTATION=